jgi:hypothetical protein
MKKLTLLFIVILSGNLLFAQKFPVDTIVKNGSPNKYINFVVMGDGFTNTEQDAFYGHTVNLLNQIFVEAPFKNYKNFFNTYAIRVVSNQSGITHPKTATDSGCASSSLPVITKDTYFGCTFDYNSIHRLLFPATYAYVSKVYNVLADNLPQYSQAFIICNSTEYGGSGGTFAVSSIHASAFDIIRHELAHSFADIGDEYWAGDFYAREHANITQQSNPDLIKWKNWLGTNNVGIYPFTESVLAKTYYRPHNNCKMRVLGAPFCNVCQQALVLSILNRANMIVEYSPTKLALQDADLTNLEFKLAQLMKPDPNTLQIRWTFDGQEISSANNQESCQLTTGMLETGHYHTLTASVTDMTDMLRVDTYEERVVRAVTWEIEHTLTNIHLVSKEEKTNYSVFPTVTSGELNVSVKSDQQAKLQIFVATLDGKIIRPAATVNIDQAYNGTLDVSYLKKGTYLLVFRLGNSSYTQKFIKQ